MKKLLILILALVVTQVQAQVVSYELIEQFSVEEVGEALTNFGLPADFLPLTYPVDYYRVEYYTPHPNGDSVLVSGALCVPFGVSCPLPLSSYQHGTVALREDVPSQLNDEGLLGVLYASVGYVITLPDFIGLGVSDLFHLYVHADSEARAAIDLMRAAVDLQQELGYNLTNQLFIWGYSQGGHATMALHSHIQNENPFEFEVTASAPMSGPYDISGSQAEVITSDEVYPTPGYLPYVVLSYQTVYGNLYEELSDIFIAPYDSIIAAVFDGEHGMSYINSLLPDVPNQMMVPEVLEAFETDPEHPIRLALEANDVYDWAPWATTRLYYCEGDDQVSYLNSEVAIAAFQENGAPDAQALNGGDYDHSGCAPLAMLAGFNLFQDLVIPSFDPSYTLNIFDATDFNESDGSIEVIFDAPGFWTYQWSNGDTGLNLENAPPGFYTLTITNYDGCVATLSGTIGIVTGVAKSSLGEMKVYPNPVDDFLFVECESCEGKLSIFNIAGQELIQIRMENENTTIDLSGLKPSVYFVKFNEWNQKIIVK